MKKSKEEIKQFSVIEMTIITSFTALVFMFVGAFILYKKYDGKIINKYKENELKDVQNVYNSLLNESHGKIDSNTLIDGAIRGMSQATNDDYSYYIPKEDSYLVNDKVFIGLGINVITTDNYLEVTNVYLDSPSEKSDILIGDLIYKIDNNETKDTPLAEFIKIIRNSKKGDLKKISIIRNNEEIEKEVIIDEIEMPSLSSYLVDKNNQTIGVIKIDFFAKNSGLQFKRAYEIIKDKTDYLVIDLRNNGGGYLSSASQIASYFLDKDMIIYSVKSKNSEEVIKNSKDKMIDKKVILLVNENTASSSEMLAFSLKENLDVKVVGKNTFGKGYVQKVLELENGGFFKFSARELFSPNGNNIEGRGLEVDFDVQLKESDNKDFQLDRALTEVLR